MEDDPRRTTRLFLIESHYEALGDDLEWSVRRFEHLAGTLGLSVWELGALCRLSISRTESCLKARKFPPPVELHLTLIARLVYPSSKPPVFPSLQIPEPSE